MTTKRFTLSEELEIRLHCSTWSDAYELAKFLKDGVDKPRPLHGDFKIFVRENSVIISLHPDDREYIKIWLKGAANFKGYELQE
ncbi:MAG: hypothetical protein MUP45_01070 [Candidatus Marinimicrobia bacterium]|nr:hypothetical protein [Candidatus Neomarinimicrobiota bacterium]